MGTLGRAYLGLEDYSKAIDYLQGCLASARRIGDRYLEGTCTLNLAAVYQDDLDLKRSLEFRQQSLEISRAIEDRMGEGQALNGLGNTYFLLDNYERAKEYYQQSLAIAREIKSPLIEGVVLGNIGNTLFKEGKLAQAEVNLRAAIQIRESLRKGLDDNKKVSLFDTQDRPYKVLQQVLIAQNRHDEALEIAERGRARAFVELLATRLNPNPTTPTKQANSSINSPNIEQIKQIAKEHNATLIQYSIIDEDLPFGDKKELHDSELFIWVIKPTGEIAFRRVISNSYNNKRPRSKSS